MPASSYLGSHWYSRSKQTAKLQTCQREKKRARENSGHEKTAFSTPLTLSCTRVKGLGYLRVLGFRVLNPQPSTLVYFCVSGGRTFGVCGTRHAGV
eukprot:366111-Chlamydomonas_euryale.AAC.15